jgi:zinc protease
LILGLLDECLQQPVFPPDYVERLRTQHLTGLAIRAQDTAEMASLTFDEIVYAGHPYSRPEEGFPETVRLIQREDLENFHRECYGPKGCVIVITGGVDPQKAIDQVAYRLESWSNPYQPPPIELPPLKLMESAIRRDIIIAGKSQADIIIGTSGPERKSLDFLPAGLGNSILGQFGMYGRIGQSVREREGLAYYAYSSMSGGIGPGVWYAAAGVDPTNIEKTIELLRKEFNQFINELVKEEELDDCKSNYLGRLPLSLESNAGVAGGILYLERHNLGLDYYYRYPDLVRSVTREEVLQVARRYLNPDIMATAVAGPLK